MELSLHVKLMSNVPFHEFVDAQAVHEHCSPKSILSPSPSTGGSGNCHNLSAHTHTSYLYVTSSTHMQIHSPAPQHHLAVSQVWAEVSGCLQQQWQQKCGPAEFSCILSVLGYWRWVAEINQGTQFEYHRELNTQQCGVMIVLHGRLLVGLQFCVSSFPRSILADLQSQQPTYIHESRNEHIKILGQSLNNSHTTPLTVWKLPHESTYTVSSSNTLTSFGADCFSVLP